MPAKAVNTSQVEVETGVYVGLRKRMLRAMRAGPERAWGFHVTDYASTCLRKAYYDKLKMYRSHAYPNFKGVSSLFLGQAVHKMIEAGSPPALSEISLAYNVKNDSSYIGTVGSPIGLERVTGTVDALYDVPGHGMVIVDYKTRHSKGYDIKAPRKENVRQVEIYALMLHRCKNIAARWGAVAYLDTSEKLEKVRVFAFPIRPLEEIRKEMATKYEFLEHAKDTGVLPPRTVETWMCDGYCPYQERCFREEEIPKEVNDIGC